MQFHNTIRSYTGDQMRFRQCTGVRGGPGATNHSYAGGPKASVSLFRCSRQSSTARRSECRRSKCHWVQVRRGPAKNSADEVNVLMLDAAQSKCSTGSTGSTWRQPSVHANHNPDSSCLDVIQALLLDKE